MDTAVLKITSDARFRLARSLMTSGGGGGDSLEGAIDIFASLLEECRNRQGETSLDAALCHYEYGNALFRGVVRRKELSDGGNNYENNNDDDAEGDKKPAASTLVGEAAARKRSLDSKAESNKKSKEEKSIENDVGKEGGNNDEEDDVALALEMLSTSFSIFDWHFSSSSSPTDSNAKNTPTTLSDEERQYSLTQIPRVLNSIGDIHSYRNQFEHAVNAYCRALPYREDAVKKRQEEGKEESLLSVEDLKCQRLLVETYALVSEALLACKEGEDVVCVDGLDTTNHAASKNNENGKNNNERKVLVAARDRIDFAQSHYEMAREKLQEICKCSH